MKPRVLITIDTEAMPARSAVAPLDRLIWGQFPQGEFGIQRMMSIAEAAGVPLTFFLDFAETALYGDGILDVGREILRRGHDLQLHLHQSILPAEFYSSRGLSRVGDLNEASPAASDALLDFLIEQQTKIAPMPVAFRGGGYRFNRRLLERFGRERIIDYSCNPSRVTQPVKTRPRAQFEWSDVGAFEIPVSCVNGFLGLPRHFDYNFNASAMMKYDPPRCVDRHRQFLQAFHKRHGNDAVAVLVMHSWSFLLLDDEKKFYVEPSDKAVEIFGALLDVLKQDYCVITASEAARLHGSGELVAKDQIPFANEPDPEPEPTGGFLSHLRHAIGW